MEEFDYNMMNIQVICARCTNNLDIHCIVQAPKWLSTLPTAHFMQTNTEEFNYKETLHV